MLTSALHKYTLINAPGIRFFYMVSRFRPMTLENLTKLANSSVNPMFDFLLDLLPQDL